MMNLFRLSADMMHLASILILLAKIKQSRSCVGPFYYFSLFAESVVNIFILFRYLTQDADFILYCIFDAIYRCCI